MVEAVASESRRKRMSLQEFPRQQNYLDYSYLSPL
jgi:hypothetical protein